MAQKSPWSVKGIDGRARDAARQAARQEGITLGAYLNKLILEDESDDTGSYQKPRHQGILDELAADPRASSLDRLIKRIEANEARSTLAITGIDQTVLSLVSRLEGLEHDSEGASKRFEGNVEEIRATQFALKERLKELEADTQNKSDLSALKALEATLDKLAVRLEEEAAEARGLSETLTQKIEQGLFDADEKVLTLTEVIDSKLADASSRLEETVNDARSASMEETRNIREQISAIEARIKGQVSDTEETVQELRNELGQSNDEVTQALGGVRSRVAELQARLDGNDARADQFDANLKSIEDSLSVTKTDVAGALKDIDSDVGALRDRLERAEALTDTAIDGLKSSFGQLESRIDAVGEAMPSQDLEALKASVDERFGAAAADLRQAIAKAREEIAEQIEKATADSTTESYDEISKTISDMHKRFRAAEERQAQTIEALAEEVGRISQSLDSRLSKIENRNDLSSNAELFDTVKQLAQVLETRLNKIEARDARAVDQVGKEVTQLASTLESRIKESERRNANAIEQVGAQVANVTTRLKSKQDNALLGDVEGHIKQSEERTQTKLEAALDDVIQQLKGVEDTTQAAISPIQKAVTSLSDRLDSVEEFTTPPDLSKFTPDRSFKLDLPKMEEIPPEMPTDPFDLPLHSEALAEDGTTIEDLELEEELDEFSGARVVSALDGADFDLDEVDEAFEPEIEAVAAGDVLEEVGEIDSIEDNFHDVDTFELPTNKDNDLSAKTPPTEPDIEALESFEIDDEIELPDFEDFINEVENDDAEAGANQRQFKNDALDLEDGFDAANDLSPDFNDKTENYLSRARQAAIEASSNDRQRIPIAKAGKSNDRKFPLLAAVGATAILATGVAGFLVLRGKQPPDAPVATVTPPTNNALASLKNESLQASEVTSDAIETTETEMAASETSGRLSDAEISSGDALAGESIEISSATEEISISENETIESDVVAIEPPVESIAPSPVSLSDVFPPAPTLQQAAADGNPIALYQLGKNQLEAGDYSTAATLIGAAAELGLASAQYEYAKMLERGQGMTRDLTKAREWTQKSAEGGNVKAMHDLAVFYAEGDGGAQSFPAAVEWFRKASEYGVVDSQYNLGILYEEGLGVSPNLSEALHWFAVAARYGDAGAPVRVDELTRRLNDSAGQMALTRADGFVPMQPDAAANGRFTDTPWSMTPRAQAREVQTLLNQLGYSAGTTDGIIGQGTRNAIRAFQEANGLSATGGVTPEFISRLKSVAANSAG